MARTVADVQLVFDVIAGPVAREAVGWRLGLPAAPEQCRERRAAAWLDDDSCPVDAGVAQVLATAAGALRAAGVAIAEGERPDFEPAAYFRTFLQLMYGEMSVGLPDSVFRAFVAAARRHAGDRAWTPLTLMPGAIAQSHREWLVASEERERYRAVWDEFFRRFDVLLAPVLPTTALDHDHRPFEERTITLRGRDYAYMQQSFWCGLATLAGLPAAVIPAGRAADGMPVGLQIIGPYLGDRVVLDFAARAEQTLGRLSLPVT
jgi:amidase